MPRIGPRRIRLDTHRVAQGYPAAAQATRSGVAHFVSTHRSRARSKSVRTRSGVCWKVWRFAKVTLTFPSSIAAVCTTSFETIQVLARCLKTTVESPDRRQALLILNNLCIPVENKAAILFGEPCAVLLNALLSLIRNRVAESYLATVALLNLSYLPDDHAKRTLYNFVAENDDTTEVASSYGCQSPSDDPFSTIRIVESLLKDFVPYVHLKVNSAEQQCCRWSMNFIRNLASVPELALSIGTTTAIPILAVRCLVQSDLANIHTWTRDSLQDACLVLLVLVCVIDDAVRVLHSSKAVAEQLVTICNELEKRQGIHQVRAIALRNRLDEMDSSQSIGYSV